MGLRAADAPGEQHSPARWERPAQPPPQLADRSRSEVRVPEDRGRGDRHLRRRALLRQRLHRAMRNIWRLRRLLKSRASRLAALAPRHCAIALAVLVCTISVAGTAGASHQPAELISTGPAGGNEPLTAAYAGSSTDGERVFFETL